MVVGGCDSGAERAEKARQNEEPYIANIVRDWSQTSDLQPLLSSLVGSHMPCASEFGGRMVNVLGQLHADMVLLDICSSP